MQKILNHCIGFRQKNITHMIIASGYYILTLILSMLTEDIILFFIVFFWSAPACLFAIYESITTRKARNLLIIPFCFILIILSIFPVAFLLFIFGIFVFRWAKKHKSKSGEKKVDTTASFTDAKNVANLQFSYSDIHTVNITGVMHEHNGIDPQTIIPTLAEDDEILLEWDSKNKYDSTAIKVKTVNGIHIGWIPKDADIKEQILNTWNNGGDVIAWVYETYELPSYPGNIGLCIGISCI